MNKRELNKEIDKAAKRASAEVTEMLQDVSRQIVDDQRVWLDDMMKDLLPPKLYEAGRMDEMSDEIHAYMQKHKIQVVFIPDSYSIRIVVNGNVHSQFITKLSMDGEPVEATPTGPVNN